MFDKYKDGSTGNIEIEGLQKFYEDLGVNAGSDIVTMLISCKMNAKAMGAYTAAEFKAGFAALGVSSMDEFKRKLPNLYQEMKTPEGFKVMYKFVFDFARDQSFKNM